MKALNIAKELVEANETEIRSIELAAGQIACDENKQCNDLLVVEKGSLRVYKRSFDGRMFTLYRVSEGQCCSLTISCILNKTTFPAIIEVEQNVLAYIISAQHVRKWLRYDLQWQAYFFSQLTQKVNQLSDLSNNLVFNSMDSRIANLLCHRLNENNMICATHQCVANEVGTSREVVSRSLRMLESRGYIRLMRGKIEVTRFDELRDFSALN